MVEGAAGMVLVRTFFDTLVILGWLRIFIDMQFKTFFIQSNGAGVLLKDDE